MSRPTVYVGHGRVTVRRASTRTAGRSQVGLPRLPRDMADSDQRAGLATRP
jgi:hypothetical protein